MYASTKISYQFLVPWHFFPRGNKSANSNSSDHPLSNCCLISYSSSLAVELMILHERMFSIIVLGLTILTIVSGQDKLKTILIQKFRGKTKSIMPKLKVFLKVHSKKCFLFEVMTSWTFQLCSIPSQMLIYPQEANLVSMRI